MADIALSKSSLQQQRDRLRLFERFLPSLELKRQQLTAEYKKAVQVLAEAEQGADQASRALTALLPILGSARMNLSGLVRIRHVEVAEEDVLGLRLPTLQSKRVSWVHGAWRTSFFRRPPRISRASSPRRSAPEKCRLETSRSPPVIISDAGSSRWPSSS